MEPQGLAVTRMVHYVTDDGRHLGATVNEVMGGNMGMAGLTIFLPQAGGATQGTTAPYSETAEPGTWHYPERA